MACRFSQAAFTGKVHPPGPLFFVPRISGSSEPVMPPIFHMKLCCAGNQTLAALLDGLSSKTLRARIWRGIIDGEVAEQTVAQHTDIYDEKDEPEPSVPG